MAVDNFNLLSNDDISKDGEEGENSGKSGLSVDNEEGDMVDFKAVGEIANSGSAFVSVGDDDNFVATIDEFLHWVRP